MTLRSVLFSVPLAAVLSSAWPQLQDDTSQAQLPFYTRSLPSVQEIEGAGTLHIPIIQSRDNSARHLPVVDEVEDEYTLPIVSSKRHLPSEQNVPSGVLTLPVVHAPAPAVVKRSVEVELESRSDVAYYAQLEIGTPPQNVYAQIDTGSWELWVNPSCAGLGSSADRTFCEAVGQYEPDDSSSSKSTSETKTLRYGIGSADIKYYTDDISLSDSATLESVKFGVATKSTEQFAGVLGISYGNGVNTKYDNFIDELKNQGITETRAFSVALGSKADGAGVIAFGGVDTGKFSGRLASLPIIPASDAPDGVARYWVQLDSISLTAPSGGDNKKWKDTSFPIFLDTGATLTLLPPSIVEKIAADLDSDGEDDAGFYNVDCGLFDKDGSIDFAFDGVTIRVPFKEIIRKFGSGSNAKCHLGIVGSDDYALLGATFLRSAYVVFDVDSDTVFMAPYENCGSDLSKIKSSDDLEGLSGSCGSNNSDSEDEEEEETNSGSDESDEENSSETTSSAEKKTTTAPTSTSTKADATSTATEAATEEATEDATETATATSTSETTTSASTTLSTASRPTPTPTESSSDSGPDLASQDDDDAAPEENSGNGDDAEGAASRLGGGLLTALGAVVAVMIML